jgi:hypothetical protein
VHIPNKDNALDSDVHELDIEDPNVDTINDTTTTAIPVVISTYLNSGATSPCSMPSSWKSDSSLIGNDTMT